MQRKCELQSIFFDIDIFYWVSPYYYNSLQLTHRQTITCIEHSQWAQPRLLNRSVRKLHHASQHYQCETFKERSAMAQPRVKLVSITGCTRLYHRLNWKKREAFSLGLFLKMFRTEIDKCTVSCVQNYPKTFSGSQVAWHKKELNFPFP